MAIGVVEQTQQGAAASRRHAAPRIGPHRFVADLPVAIGQHLADRAVPPCLVEPAARAPERGRRDPPHLFVRVAQRGQLSAGIERLCRDQRRQRRLADGPVVIGAGVGDDAGQARHCCRTERRDPGVQARQRLQAAHRFQVGTRLGLVGPRPGEEAQQGLFGGVHLRRGAPVDAADRARHHAAEPGRVDQGDALEPRHHGRDELGIPGRLETIQRLGNRGTGRD